MKNFQWMKRRREKLWAKRRLNWEKEILSFIDVKGKSLSIQLTQTFRYSGVKWSPLLKSINRCSNSIPSSAHVINTERHGWLNKATYKIGFFDITANTFLFSFSTKYDQIVLGMLFCTAHYTNDTLSLEIQC